MHRIIGRRIFDLSETHKLKPATMKNANQVTVLTMIHDMKLIQNPVTGNMQKVEDHITELGFDENGMCLFQKGVKNNQDVIHGGVASCVHFVSSPLNSK